MTNKELRAFARIVASHEYAAAELAATGQTDQTLNGCIRTDDRILSEVLGIHGEAAKDWKARAMAAFSREATLPLKWFQF